MKEINKNAESEVRIYGRNAEDGEIKDNDNINKTYEKFKEVEEDSIHSSKNIPIKNENSEKILDSLYMFNEFKKFKFKHERKIVFMNLYIEFNVMDLFRTIYDDFKKKIEVYNINNNNNKTINVRNYSFIFLLKKNE